eukprot:gene23-4274_t
MGSILTTEEIDEERTTSNTKWSEYKIGSVINLRPFVYHKEEKCWKIKKKKKTTMELKKISIVSYNVWFSDHMKTERFSELLKISKDSDVICLQEVTPKNISYLKELDWIQEGYEVSDISGSSVIPYGVVILSKIPLEKFSMKILKTNMCRMNLNAHISINDENVIISTVHLESLNHPDLRFDQLTSIFEYLDENSTNLIMGDFNFDSERNYNLNDGKSLENDNLLKFPDYKDIWSLLNKDESSGKTFDTKVNTMLKGSREEVMRYDRILIKSKTWSPTAIEIIGNSSFGQDQDGYDIFPSDHFGLKTIIEYK